MEIFFLNLLIIFYTCNFMFLSIYRISSYEFEMLCYVNTLTQTYSIHFTFLLIIYILLWCIQQTKFIIVWNLSTCNLGKGLKWRLIFKKWGRHFSANVLYLVNLTSSTNWFLIMNFFSSKSKYWIHFYLNIILR